MTNAINSNEQMIEKMIVGEEIPSVVDDNYRCQVIQFYEIEPNRRNTDCDRA